MVALHNSTWSSASRDGTLEIRLAGEIELRLQARRGLGDTLGIQIDTIAGRLALCGPVAGRETLARRCRDIEKDAVVAIEAVEDRSRNTPCIEFRHALSTGGLTAGTSQ